MMKITAIAVLLLAWVGSARTQPRVPRGHMKAEATFTGDAFIVENHEAEECVDVSMTLNRTYKYKTAKVLLPVSSNVLGQGLMMVALNAFADASDTRFDPRTKKPAVLVLQCTHNQSGHKTVVEAVFHPSGDRDDAKGVWAHGAASSARTPH